LSAAAPDVVVAPAALKGVLAATDAAAALAAGFAQARVEARRLPIADGGDGTADVLAAVLGGHWRTARVSDALGRPIEARWLVLPDGTAVVESAEAIGLRRLAVEELDPLRASSRGLGELIRAAEREQPRAVVVCLGGSATVDGGAGLREVIGSLSFPTTVLHDVRTTLGDAARLYGPQKGAGPQEVEELDARLRSLEELRPYAHVEGSGSAGGLGAAFAALGAKLVPGADYVLRRIGFSDAVAEADLVVTGEGTVDATTLEGKAPGEALRSCLERGVRCVIFGGTIDVTLPGAELRQLSGDPARARSDLVSLGKRLCRELLE
jgi:glycerate 2-kinase